MTEDLAALTAGVELLSLDAGNTVVFLDHERVARLVSALGEPVDAAGLRVAEGAAKRGAEDGTLRTVRWSGEALPAARGWAAVMATMLEAAGIAEARLGRLLDALWEDHGRLNLFARVPPDLPGALRRARAAGLRVAVVSNSEGRLAELFEALGILGLFDAVIDSGREGIEKPDPRIFALALARCGGRPDTTLHLGDVYATDTLGARAAGLRTALLDPYGHLDGRHPDVPRVASVAAVAGALVREAHGARRPVV